MERKLTRALCRNVFEMCGVIKAKAIVIIELDKGERLWAANGSFRDEFLDKGRILNADDTEIDLSDAGLAQVNLQNENGEYDGDETEEEPMNEGHVVVNGSAISDEVAGSVSSSNNVVPLKPLSGAGNASVPTNSTVKTTVIGQKRKTEKALPPATEDAKKIRNDKPSKPSSTLMKQYSTPLEHESPGVLKRPNDQWIGVKLRENQLKFAGLTQGMLWHGKNAIQWLKVAKTASSLAINDEKYSQWHLDHPVLCDAEWHILMYLRFRLHRPNDIQEIKTSTKKFWIKLKNRSICERCLCFVGVATIDKEKGLTKHPFHAANFCENPKRCRVCAHAHDDGTPCVCPCWVNSLKAAEIIHWNDTFAAQYFQLPMAEDKKSDDGKAETPQVEAQAASDSLTSAPSTIPASGNAFLSPSLMDEEVIEKELEDDLPRYQTVKSKAPKIVKAEMIEWRENDLATTLHLVHDIIVREAKKGHRPLHDLSAHLTLWLDNAAAGRYSSFFSHVLVNGFCQGCCCFMDEPSGSDDEEDGDDDVVIVEVPKTQCNKHLMAECAEKCCGEFLCKICLHKHPVNGNCDCQCVVTALEALGLLEDDAEKVQESTKKRWEKIHKGKSAQMIQKKVLAEISDW